MAHHDAKINSYTPSYPLLSEESRQANPPQRVPLVLTHPLTGRRALYGLNGSTCAVLPKGQPLPQPDLDRADLEGVEHPSVVAEWRSSLLPFATQEEFTVVWEWEEGDVAIWDNRTTLHCASRYDDTKEGNSREMWRTTVVKDHPRSVLAAMPKSAL